MIACADDDWDDDAADVDADGPARPVVIVALFAAMAAVFGVLVGVHDLHGRVVQARYPHPGDAFYWAGTGSGWEVYVLLAATMALLGTIFGRPGVAMKAGWIVLILWVEALVLLWNAEAYFAVIGTRVEVHAAAPGRGVVAFDLARADIVARGCGRRAGGRRGAHPVFVVRDPATGAQVDIAAGINNYRVDGWLRVMRPYLDGSIPLTQGIATARMVDCMNANTVLLDDARRADVRFLLGGQR